MALNLGLRGVGMWEADSLDYVSQDKHQYLHDMWDTLPWTSSSARSLHMQNERPGFLIVIIAKKSELRLNVFS